jgi:hypothetical protein
MRLELRRPLSIYRQLIPLEMTTPWRRARGRKAGGLARPERGEFKHDLEEVKPARRAAVVLLSETKPAKYIQLGQRYLTEFVSGKVTSLL